ncbi:MAG: coenzyme F420-0:L-glutamate ligase [Anaerolineae bacterium]
MPRPDPISISPVLGMPLVSAGDDLAALIAAALDRNRMDLAPGDVLVVAHKVVSKAEGRTVDLAAVRPGREARRVADVVGKDPHLVEIVLAESRRVVRAAPGVLVVETHHGFICANAGVDLSNAPSGTAVCLPQDPDASARRLRRGIGRATGVAPAVVVADSHGRPWRLGTVGLAIGAAGIGAVDDLRGTLDLYGRRLKATEVGRIDAVAAAATLVMGEADEGVPAALVRGARFSPTAGGARDALRDPERDLFR